MNKPIWHIVPENDSELHISISEEQTIIDTDGNMDSIVVCSCKCEPNVIDEHGFVKIVHNAFDGGASGYFQNPYAKQINEKEEILIGTLKKKWGLKGFKTAMPGHSVYDDGSRYVVYLEPEISGDIKRVTFYKEALNDWI